MSREIGASGWSLPVLLGGVGTTVATLFGVWWLDAHSSDWHIMGWYANYVLPVGAILVGLACGSGYGLASWITGLKIQHRLLAAVLLLQLGAYGAAEWLEFRATGLADQVIAETGQRITFPLYFHAKTMSFHWDNHGRPGDPLGGWGYLFVGLAMAGFVAGGVLAPALLRRLPYCERCARYMRRRQLGVFPASVPFRRVSKKDPAATAAYAEEQQCAADQNSERLRRIADLCARHDGAAVRELATCEPRQSRAAMKLPLRMALSLVHCASCADAHLQPVMWTGQGKGMRSTKLEKIPAGPEIAKLVL
jgi:hypothetical protein